jgi:hypothetical protein
VQDGRPHPPTPSPLAEREGVLIFSFFSFPNNSYLYSFNICFLFYVLSGSFLGVFVF